MDSFEARLQFIQVIKNLQKSLNVSKNDSDISATHQNSVASSATNSLSASNSYTNIQELDDNTIESQVSKSMSDPIQFYMKHYAHHFEDFHQCLFDTGLKMNPLHRLNIVIFYYQILMTLVAEIKQKKLESGSLQVKVVYDHLIPAMPNLFELCLPKEDWKALANLKSCTDIYYNLLRLLKTLPDFQLPSSEELTLKEYSIDSPEVRQQINSAVEWVTIPSDDEKSKSTIELTKTLLNDRIIKKYVAFRNFVDNSVCNLKNSSNNSGNTSNILHRMENDRERHKRQKETLWVVERSSQSMLDENEFKIAWNTCPTSLSKTDIKDTHELYNIAKSSYIV
ncbi:hypothetical protein RNJ44_03692 [Nakaseomyces bracarensis]|uniref:CTD kinase subunit gamma Ctk3 C-terminal domain-containing protein n=1 Tax=Nakaseomyces bracarensis TaxID=273131 RepID=A0ABR4NXV6_9SACH